MAKSALHCVNRGRVSLIVVLMACCLWLTGCMVGYKTFKTEPYNAVQPTASLSHVKILYSADNNLRFPLERTMRGKFGIIDSRFRDPENFVIEAGMTTEDKHSAIWLFMSILSCAVIPAVWDNESILIFKITAPRGERKSFRYAYLQRSYTWLPFLFAAPGYFNASGHGFDSSDLEHIQMRDTITTRFMLDATPFILSHSTPTRK